MEGRRLLHEAQPLRGLSTHELEPPGAPHEPLRGGERIEPGAGLARPDRARVDQIARCFAVLLQLTLNL